MASAEDIDATRELVDSLLETAKDRLLDISLVDVLLGGWVKLKAIQQYATGDKLESDQTHKHTLSEHSVSSKHAPRMELYVFEQKVCDVPLEIKLSLVLAKLNLMIRKGRIVELKMSRCKAAATVSCHGHKLISKDSEDIEFPPSIKLGKGIAIPPPLKYKSGAGPP